jgi:hypothetical protein
MLLDIFDRERKLGAEYSKYDDHLQSKWPDFSELNAHVSGHKSAYIRLDPKP